MIKSKSKVMAVMLAAMTSATMFAGCGAADRDTITVISREDGSGTRGAFIELTGVEEKDADGNKTDTTKADALICKSTDVVLTQVAGDENAIGYVSFGSLNDTVKAISVDGTMPTTETIESGDYSIVRPFNIATNKSGVSEVTQDFVNYIMSAEGQQIIVDNKYISADKSAAAFTTSGATGKVTVSGSSSVTPVMEKLGEAYTALTGNEVEVQQSDSSTGMKDAISGTSDIGMASREQKDEELTDLNGTVIAQDAIAIIVNKNNEIDNLTVENIKKIYTGSVESWSEVQ